MNPENKQLNIDFLYLDLTVCGRCQGAEANLEEAIKDASESLIKAGYEVQLNKVNISSKELAVEYEFLSSPTIRINGEDIALEVHETVCQECGDLCGDTVECRVWVYNGVEYTEPPKAMIVEAILKSVNEGKIGRPASSGSSEEPYRLPHNLKVFFDGYETIEV